MMAQLWEESLAVQYEHRQTAQYEEGPVEDVDDSTDRLPKDTLGHLAWRHSKSPKLKTLWVTWRHSQSPEDTLSHLETFWITSRHSICHLMTLWRHSRLPINALDHLDWRHSSYRSTLWVTWRHSQSPEDTLIHLEIFWVTSRHSRLPIVTRSVT